MFIIGWKFDVEFFVVRLHSRNLVLKRLGSVALKEELKQI